MLKSTVLFYVVLLLTCAFSSVATLRLSKAEVDAAFESFKKTYNKSYQSEAIEAYRKKIFINNLGVIEEVNEKAETFVAGITKFTDNTQREIQKNLLTYREEEETNIPGGVIITSLVQSKKLKNRTNQNSCTLINPAILPNTVDYREITTLSPIRDQGWCGACWTFATIFQLEYYYSKKTGNMIDLSVQQLVDCNTGNFACDGGTLSKAFSFHQTWKTTKYENYPYIDGKGECKYLSPAVVTPAIETIINTPVTLLNAKIDKVIDALIKFGPLLTTVDSTFLPYYVSGIFDPAAFEYDCLYANHAVNIVGAGVDSNTGKVYFIVRNSWGPNWGENGYFRIFACDCKIGNRSMYATMK